MLLQIFASNPLVTIVLFNGVWKTFNLDAQSCLDRAADKDEKLCCWHVCDLRIESDSRFSEQVSSLSSCSCLVPVVLSCPPLSLVSSSALTCPHPPAEHPVRGRQQDP
eukprot:747175-Hanusia_phi.AAC.13